jgi:alkyl hydroperoxide reductase subunit AhpC
MPSYEAQSAEFERRDAQVVGISVDSIPCHKAWARSFNGIQSYPLLSDFHPKGEVAKKYGVYRDSVGESERAILIVDKEGIVRFIDVHDINEQPDNRQLFEELDKLA